MAQENQRSLVIIPGDGIGPEIIDQAGRVVEWFDDNRSTTRPAWSMISGPMPSPGMMTRLR